MSDKKVDWLTLIVEVTVVVVAAVAKAVLEAKKEK